MYILLVFSVMMQQHLNISWLAQERSFFLFCQNTKFEINGLLSEWVIVKKKLFLKPNEHRDRN